jgi:hypothetical protein
MENYVAITAFSPEGYDVYGEKFVRTFLQHWGIPLYVYYETQRPPITHRLVHYVDLDQDEDRRRFTGVHDTPEKRGHEDRPNMQSIRFCHKVFAVTSCKPDARWLLWLDADVETYARVDGGLLKKLCPEHAVLSYLGRELAGAYTECGFVAYRIEDLRVRFLLRDMRAVYTTGKLFELGDDHWHDSYVFDYCRHRSGIPQSAQHDLARGLRGWHVWPDTLLGGVAWHRKGPSRKLEAYGRVVP